ncbi:hypothetical protein SNE32_07265 [Lysobacter sp. D1-1-M9]
MVVCVAGALGACAHSQHPSIELLEHADEASAYTAFGLGYVPALDVYRLRTHSRIKGRLSGDLHLETLDKLDVGSARDSVRWEITGASSLNVVQHRDVISTQIRNASNIIREYDLLDESLSPTIRVVLVPADQEIDVVHQSIFKRSPKFEFYVSVAGAGSEFEDHLISGTSNIIHELVHFKFAYERTDRPGRGSEAHLINGELVASAVDECARMDSAINAHSGRPDIMLPPLPKRATGDAALREIHAMYGPSVVGQVLAYHALSSIPKESGKVLSAQDVEQIYSACKSMIESPADYWSRALAGEKLIR